MDEYTRNLERLLEKANNRIYQLEVGLYELYHVRIKNAEWSNNTIEEDMAELGLIIQDEP